MLRSNSRFQRNSKNSVRFRVTNHPTVPLPLRGGNFCFMLFRICGILKQFAAIMRASPHSYKSRIVCGRETLCALIRSARLGASVMRDTPFMDSRVRDLELQMPKLGATLQTTWGAKAVNAMLCYLSISVAHQTISRRDAWSIFWPSHNPSRLVGACGNGCITSVDEDLQLYDLHVHGCLHFFWCAH